MRPGSLEGLATKPVVTKPSIDDGGAAFPEPVAVGPAGDVYHAFCGMSLRTWFAGQALTTLSGNANPETAARYAVGYADALIAELKKGGAS